MKTIIILGEEYWFKIYDFEASTLLNELKNNKPNRFNYVIIETPLQLLNTINFIGLDNLRGIFLFHDVLTNSNLNNKTILEMKSYLKKISTENNIYIYPDVDIIDTFGGKKYYNTLIKNLNFAALPHSQVLCFPNYQPFKDEKVINEKLWLSIKNMFNIFNTVVLKKGYSYEAKQVVFLHKHEVTDFFSFLNKIKYLNIKKFFGKISNSIHTDKGIDRYYILQGYNDVVKNRDNEYRIFFVNGTPQYIAKGPRRPNTCIEDHLDNPLENEIIKFANNLYKKFIPLIWKATIPPILFRIDVSYALDIEFQDEHSIMINGYDYPIRIYANELEIDPTSYFFNRFICNKNSKFNTHQVQLSLGKAINNYINELL